ncbi:PLD nuclease N-terminal domain-containing protein [Brevibacterium sp. GP-SGM9]|uniref:PLD nuclease N-terminal domain-containing protein n=1 Tax=unclassified Brevibacterium TaxID=2614124 RepID=UPI001E3E5878|nr:MULTISPECIES: PLD nuclease N-terminal domain-containing protein [unclassified Brevibacterium]MCD1287098.1 hypothetical protein [Brevibacterium sp. CCUG 69071]MDK8436326.1 PLD nuclease N-terminal domain-containing protein [Brevibacterium sp. H-BE7]
MNENPLLPAAYDIIWSGILLAFVALLIWAFVSIYRSDLDAPSKLVWAIIVFLLPVIGPICWFVIKSRRTVSQFE